MQYYTAYSINKHGGTNSKPRKSELEKTIKCEGSGRGDGI